MIEGERVEASGILGALRGLSDRILGDCIGMFPLRDCNLRGGLESLSRTVSIRRNIPTLNPKP